MRYNAKNKTKTNVEKNTIFRFFLSLYAAVIGKWSFTWRMCSREREIERERERVKVVDRLELITNRT